MTSLIDKILDRGSAASIAKNERNVVDQTKDIGKFKLKEGSMIEYIPNYNDLFNKGKLKVFPLQSIEAIIADPSKQRHN